MCPCSLPGWAGQVHLLGLGSRRGWAKGHHGYTRQDLPPAYLPYYLALWGPDPVHPPTWPVFISLYLETIEGPPCAHSRAEADNWSNRALPEVAVRGKYHHRKENSRPVL